MHAYGVCPLPSAPQPRWAALPYIANIIHIFGAVRIAYVVYNCNREQT